MELKRNVVEEMMVQKFREKLHSLSDEELSAATEKFLSEGSTMFPKDDLFTGGPPLASKSSNGRKLTIAPIVPEALQNTGAKSNDDLSNTVDKDLIKNGKMDEEVDETNSLLTALGGRSAEERDAKQVELVPQSTSTSSFEDSRMLARFGSILQSLPFNFPQTVAGVAVVGALFGLLFMQFNGKGGQNDVINDQNAAKTDSDEEKPALNAVSSTEKLEMDPKLSPGILWQRKEGATNAINPEQNGAAKSSQNGNNVIWRRVEDKKGQEAVQPDGIDFWRVPLEELRVGLNDVELKSKPIMTGGPKEGQGRHTSYLRSKRIGHKIFKGSALDNAEPPDLEQEIDMQRS